MRWWSELKYIMRKLNRRQAEQESGEEIQTHLELETREQIEAGLSPEEALYAARRAFGSVALAREESRAVWGLRAWEIFWQDLRYGMRMLLKNPGFSLIAIFTLALGIGATTAIFSVVNGVLLKPLPYPQPEELVAVNFTIQGFSFKDTGASDTAYFIFREQSRTFQEIGLYSYRTGGFSVNVTRPGEPERVPALVATDSLLPMLRVTPLHGRFFTREDDSPESPETVILTYGYWSRKFGGDRSIIGRTIELDGKLHTIIGVLPEGFRFLDQSNLALVLPLKLDREKAFLGSFQYQGIARLNPGVTLAQANADVARMLPIVARSFPTEPGFSLKQYEDYKLGPGFQPLKQAVVGDVGKVLWVLMCGISLVLLIACANLANLLLVRAEGRRREFAIRVALGASRGRIAAQLFFEGLILAVFGGLLGLGLANVALRVLVAMAPQGLPRLHEIGVDEATILFTLALSLVTSLIFCSIPAFKYAGAGLGIGLREGERSMSESRERHRARSVLVIVQVALALVLLVSSGLMIRTFHALTRVNPGFAAPPSEVQTFRIGIRDVLVKPERVVRIEEEILHKLEAIPGVSSVGLSGAVPFGGGVGWDSKVFAKDRPSAQGEGALSLPCRFGFVAPGFFKTLGTPLLAGRDFTWSDIYNIAPIAIVSEKFAREYWSDPASALGKQIRQSQKGDWLEVVGVVGDVHQDGVDKEAPASVYWPILVANIGGADILVIRNPTFSIRSTRAGSEGLVNEIRQAVRSVVSNLPLAEVNTLDYYYAMSMARTSFILVTLAIAGGMSLFIGIVGLYGVIAYSASQRRREIGIRMALGAGRAEVLKMVISQGVKLASIGVAIGLAGALGLTRFLSG
ncbi:MAG: ABC transporter permease, partial [Blastocatellia bacterium]|nr:ABC transporter permease [Blastocatellia bacterium]